MPPIRAERDPDDVARIARSLGCTVTRYQRQIDGSIAVLLDCPTHQAKVDLIVALGIYDAEHFPDVVRLARAIIAGTRDDCERLRVLQRWVQDHVAMVFEPIEIYPSSLTVLEVGSGDCDDHTILVVALATALGYAATAEAFPAPNPSHVAARVRCRGRWLWLETTVPAELGEHPLAAARRLGINTRFDIHG